MLSLCGFLDGGNGPKVIWSECSCHHEKKQENNPHRDSGSVWQSHPENNGADGVKQSSTEMTTSAINTSPSAQYEWN